MRGRLRLLVLWGLTVASCGSPRALVLLDVVGDQPFGPVTLRVVAGGKVSTAFPDVGFDQTTPFRAGVYLPGDVSGATTILATAEAGACVVGRGQVTVPGVSAGVAAPPVGLTIAHVSCEPIPGSDGGMGAGGSGGGAGTGGVGGSGNGSGGTPGAGGSPGPGGAGDSGGVSGSGGVLGSGGAPGSGGGPGGAGGSGTGGRLGTGGGGPGTGGGTAGAGAGGSGTGGAGGGCGALVDDMESATGRICQGSGRVGHWYTFKDSNGSTISPDPAQLPALPEMVSPPRDTSHYAMRTHGTRVSYAGMGCMLNNSVIGDPPHGFDARAYSGIQLYARGINYAINVTVHNGATISTAYGGHCTSTICVGNWTYVSGISSDWGMTRVPFSTLAGGNAPFDPSDLWSLEFQVYGDATYDFWIDDISFY